MRWGHELGRAREGSVDGEVDSLYNPAETRPCVIASKVGVTRLGLKVRGGCHFLSKAVICHHQGKTFEWDLALV